MASARWSRYMPPPMAEGNPVEPPVPFDPPTDDGPIQGGPAEPPVIDPTTEPPGSTSPPAPPAPPPPPPPNQDVDPLPTDIIGDIPPPPIPPPPTVEGIGPAGIPGTEGSTFARPGTSGAVPFHTAAFVQRPPRFGPGVPVLGGGSAAVDGLGLSPDDAAELLRALAAGRTQ